MSAVGMELYGPGEIQGRFPRPPEWIRIPSGPAIMGSDCTDELPRELVELEAYRISRFAITNDQYRMFVDDDGYLREDFWDADAFEVFTASGVREPAFWQDDSFNRPSQPVTGVCFFEATAFARWAGCRLPTEVEWMKAAGGPDGLCYPWGSDEPSVERAKFAPGFCPTSAATANVEECEAGDSFYGCRQMAGNLFEWCSDAFRHESTPGRRDSATRFEIRRQERRVLKGGAWTTGAGRLRVAARWFLPAGVRDNVMGIRLVSGSDAP